CRRSGGVRPFFLKRRGRQGYSIAAALRNCPVGRKAVRVATVERNTKETRIKGRVALDGSGMSEISTGIGFLDHMLDQLAKHSLVDITLPAKGDLHTDSHPPTKAPGNVIAAAVAKALGARAGIQRY